MPGCAARSRGRRSRRWSATAARRYGDAEAVVDGTRRVDFADARRDGRRRGAGAARVGHRARRPGRGVGAELARVDRRRARRDDRGRRARAGQHALPRRRGGVRPRPQRRAGAVHGARVPRHRLPGAARERRASRCPRSSTRSCSSGDADDGVDRLGRVPRARAARCSDAELDARVAAIGADDPSDVVFTSGTTGQPEGRRDDARPDAARVPRLVRLGRPARRATAT